MERATVTDVRQNTGGIDPIQQIILDELRGTRREINDRLDKLVTTEAFQAEQRRVDDRHEEHTRNTNAEHIAIRRLVETKVEEAKAGLDEKIEQSTKGWKGANLDREKRDENRWNWFKWAVGILFTALALSVSIVGVILANIK
jgi:hypothetical protein